MRRLVAGYLVLIGAISGSAIAQNLEMPESGVQTSDGSVAHDELCLMQQEALGEGSPEDCAVNVDDKGVYVKARKTVRRTTYRTDFPNDLWIPKQLLPLAESLKSVIQRHVKSGTKLVTIYEEDCPEGYAELFWAATDSKSEEFYDATTIVVYVAKKRLIFPFEHDSEKVFVGGVPAGWTQVGDPWKFEIPLITTRTTIDGFKFCFKKPVLHFEIPQSNEISE